VSNGNATLEVLEARCDYLTATVGQGYKAAILASRCAEWQSARAKEGYPIKAFRYSGYLGESTDGITWGSREDGSLVRLSGEMAHRHHQTALTFVSNVSRIDLEVTLLSSVADANFAEQCHYAARADQRVKAGMTRTSIIRSTPRGATCYIGSRSSDRYFRVYDKTAESEGAYPNWSWRFEVEYKKDRAWRVAQEILKGHGRPETIRGIVEQAFLDYGYHLPCLALPPSWRDKGVRHETNDERRLAWLQKSIRPMIENLSEGVPLGTVLEALGLPLMIDADTGEMYARTTDKLPVDYNSFDFEGVATT